MAKLTGIQEDMEGFMQVIDENIGDVYNNVRACRQFLLIAWLSGAFTAATKSKNDDLVKEVTAICHGAEDAFEASDKKSEGSLN
jgi:hypothetical protein